MGFQITPNSQNNLIKEVQTSRTHNSLFQNLQQSYSNQNKDGYNFNKGVKDGDRTDVSINHAWKISIHEQKN